MACRLDFIGKDRKSAMTTKNNELIAKSNTQYPKSNVFINSKTKRTLQEEKILAIALNRVQKLPEVNGNIVCEMRAAELVNIFDDKSKSLYAHLRQISNRFMNNGLIGYTDPENNRFDYLNVVTRAKYENGVFTLKFNGDLKEHLIGMSKNYTLLDLPIMMKFNSVYSFRIYEVIKSNEYKLTYKRVVPFKSYELEYSIAEFKFLVGVANASEDKVKDLLSGSAAPDWDKAIEVCENQKYKDWRNFKRNVLDVAQKEINEKTDLHVEYDYIKAGNGGKIVGLKIIATPQNNLKKSPEKDYLDHKKELTEDERIDLIEQASNIIKEKVTLKEIRSILEDCEYDIEKVNRLYQLAQKQKTPIEGIVGWMRSAIKNDYRKPVAMKKSCFTNFKQNEIDFEELERQLVEN